ncbi:uracil-DNA glycosylase [Ruminococcus albus]|uniref:Uracil-DNA glycosylase n=1 Tax=Ruminococcus albus 8 TaxID=246199 RepID=E9SCX8_RUMAL|nr:uracil-DNA glycosylase [Ruminococcus albus]EGC02851.1 uracil-DNA glycosylase [Ruminococcus albus 8]MBE6874786.1 uracil-DNA glycosylase [Ruminococcus albus]MCC3352491.1 uracil-DNA glycosylase [Ruminococcus albus 8]
MVNIGNSWDSILADEFKSPYYLQLREFLKREYATQTIYPDMYDIFNALKYTAYEDVKAVIIGQDPYHGEGQAHGLCFSVKRGIAPPPSLQNIFKELQNDVGFRIPNNGELTDWTKQGVLLLNAVLTVRAGQANSHRGKGWEKLTDAVIRKLNEREKPIVFMLWGRNAKEKQALITNSHHLVLTAAHPSPLSAYNGFFGCRHFSTANDFLKYTGQQPIDWSVSDK